MISVRLFTRNLVSVLIALVLAGSLSLPINANASATGKVQKANAKKATSKASKRATAKKKSRTRSTKSHTSRKVKASSVKSVKGKRASSRNLRANRGNVKSRGKWRRKPVRKQRTYSRTPIHSFLTQSWTGPHASYSQVGQAGSMVPPSASPHNMVVGPSALQLNELPSNTDGDSVELPAGVLHLNPVVNAYMTTLVDRGFDPEGQGFLVSSLDGEVLAEHNADRAFNPASVVKVATSLVAVSKLGPDFRFRTSVYTDGLLDPATGILDGSLYIIGSGDPAFFYENALLIADKLNRNGIKVVNGNLFVLGNFYFNLSSSREHSAREFRKTLTPETWGPGVSTAYVQFLAMRHAEEMRAAGQSVNRRPTISATSGAPSLTINGETITNPVVDTTRLSLLAVHTSLPLVRVLKGLNDFSNNWMASVIGGMIGGPHAVQNFLRTEIGLRDDELSIVTASGLGSNMISPRGTTQILRKLITYLQKEGIGIEQVLPVAGIDRGTLEKRFTDAYRGSVVAKTGTLRSVSALAGVAYTRGRGPLVFVIYNRGGSPAVFRSVQDETLRKLITLFGGPAPVGYSPTGAPQISKQSSESAEEPTEGSQQ